MIRLDKIINGVRYQTNGATQLASDHGTGLLEDEKEIPVILYRSGNGNYFFVVCYPNRQKVIPLLREQAVEFYQRMSEKSVNHEIAFS